MTSCGSRYFWTRATCFIGVCLFACDSCGFRNSEVNFGGEIQPQGVRMELEVREKADLDRQCIKADSATVSVPVTSFSLSYADVDGARVSISGEWTLVANEAKVPFHVL